MNEDKPQDLPISYPGEPAEPVKAAPRNALRILVVLLALFALGSGLVIYQQGSFGRPLVKQTYPTVTLGPTLKPSKPQLVSSQSQTTIVYGAWETGASTIKAVNSDKSNHVTIAKLPFNIKDVNVLDNNLIYIAQTDDKDHGKEIDLYNLETGQTQTLIAAEPDFGIDDIVLSSDKKWLATWEVKFAQGANILSGGQSKVFTVNLANPTQKNLIISESNISATNPLRYPLFFDSQNRLFLDTFGPNGGGWNLGLFVVNNDGTNLQEVPGMTDGQYSFDPVTSASGTKAVFAAYNPNATPQIAANPQGVLRPAQANPNLLQVMELSNFQKSTPLGYPNGILYSNPLWFTLSDKIVFQMFQIINPDQTKYAGVYVFDLATNTLASGILQQQDKPFIILKFNEEGVFWGETDTNPGNLGPNYNSMLSSLSLTNITGDKTDLILKGQNIQFIAALDKQPGTPLAFSISDANLQKESASSLALGSFQVKPLAQTRGPQQNDPPPGAPTPTGPGGTPRCCELYGSCVGNINAFQRLGTTPTPQTLTYRSTQQPKCYDSPLYLYPQEETDVNVKVGNNAQILYSQPKYSDGWQVKAFPNGKLQTNDGSMLDKINYNYLTSYTSLPKTGLVVEKDKLESTLESYAKNLGLQDQEALDFVSFWQATLPNSAYYLISHFSKNQSQTILPLKITPQPNTLIQVVMYFRPLEKQIDTSPPVFEPIPQRRGFVAVDWSGIIDY